MIEIHHTNEDGSTWTEWVPEDAPIWSSGDWAVLLHRAQEHLDNESRETARALRRLDFKSAFLHARAVVLE